MVDKSVLVQTLVDIGMSLEVAEREAERAIAKATKERAKADAETSALAIREAVETLAWTLTPAWKEAKGSFKVMLRFPNRDSMSVALSTLEAGIPATHKGRIVIELRGVGKGDDAHLTANHRVIKATCTGSGGPGTTDKKCPMCKRPVNVTGKGVFKKHVVA